MVGTSTFQAWLPAKLEVPPTSSTSLGGSRWPDPAIYSIHYLPVHDVENVPGGEAELVLLLRRVVVHSSHDLGENYFLSLDLS